MKITTSMKSQIILFLTICMKISVCFQFHHFRTQRKLSYLGSTTNEIKDTDDQLYGLFLNQISKLSKGDSIPSDDGTEALTDSDKVMNNRQLIETVTELNPGCPVEFINHKRLFFGNFLRSKDSGSGVEVRVSSGKVVQIDISQIVSVWDLLSDEWPDSVEDWAGVASDALDLLGKTSPRKSDLQEFWQIMSQRSSILPVDSLDLGVYVYQERRFRSWINPEISSDIAGVRALSAAQRYASALLLFHDDFHFKRRPTRLAEENDFNVNNSEEDSIGDNDDDGESEDHDTIYIIEGGYKILDDASTLFREGEVFAKYFEERVKLSSSQPSTSESIQEPFRPGCITRQLRALELYALSSSKMTPPAAVKHILKRLSQPKSPEGATEILKQMKTAALITNNNLMNTNNNDLYQKNNKPSNDIFNQIYNRNSVKQSVTPWTPAELEAAQKVYLDAENRRQEWENKGVYKVGKRDPSGRMDYRGNVLEHPVICIDSRTTSFFDDAFSLSPETGEILVHVVDVCAAMRRSPILQETAKERLASTFTPSGPLHMLPPAALEGLKLSSTGPNEVLTVAVSVNAATGDLYGFRVFPSVIGPVTPIDVDTADEFLLGIGVNNMGNPGSEVSVRAGYSNALIRDLLRTQRLMKKVMLAKSSWIDVHFSNSTTRKINLNKKSGVYEQHILEKTTANRLVNSLLTLYSNASYIFCLDHEVPVPITWENRDRVNSQLIRRFASQPLRSWISQLQQKQLRAALKMELPLTKKDCAIAVSYSNSKRKLYSPFQNRGREQMLFESFEAHCANIFSSGGSVICSAEGLGEGGSVRIREFSIEGTVNKNIAKGEQVQVRVVKVVPETRSAVIELV